jgi:methionyl-tRNA synthetase
MERFSDEWYIEAGRLARNYCPTIYDCKKCSYPVVSGYQCTYCGDTNPSETKKHKEFLKKKYTNRNKRGVNNG